MKVTKSRKWKEAEWDYSAIQANRVIPESWGAFTQEDSVKGLKGIMRRCPQYYPAVLEVGFYQTAMKGDKPSERMVEKGFQLLVELAPPEHMDKEIEAVIDNLEKIW